MEDMYCQAIDIRDSLLLDAASIQVELAMHLKKFHIRYQELSQLCISIDRAGQAAWLIKSHSDAKKHAINFFLLEFARSDHPRASQLLSRCELQDRLKKNRMFMERTAEARQAVQRYIEDPFSLVEGRLRFRCPSCTQRHIL
jgi:hypothetical protein